MLENYLSKWGRRIALGVFLAWGAGVIALLIAETGPAQWLINTQDSLLGFHSRKLALVLLLVPGLLVANVLAFLHDWLNGIGYFRPEGERVYIEIIGVPRGEAPEWVRQAWIGAVLPLLPGREEPQSVATSGVVSRKLTSTGTQPYWADGKYAVLMDEAIAVLEKHAPKAAEWWRTNTPALFGRGRALAFEAAVCRKMEPDQAAIEGYRHAPGQDAT